MRRCQYILYLINHKKLELKISYHLHDRLLKNYIQYILILKYYYPERI